MENVLIDIEYLKNVVRESVKEAIKEERLMIMESIIPFVNKDEMDEIISKYGKNPPEEEFTDMTEWLAK